MWSTLCMLVLLAALSTAQYAKQCRREAGHKNQTLGLKGREDLSQGSKTTASWLVLLPGWTGLPSQGLLLRTRISKMQSFLMPGVVCSLTSGCLIGPEHLQSSSLLLSDGEKNQVEKHACRETSQGGRLPSLFQSFSLGPGSSQNTPKAEGQLSSVGPL